MHQSFENLTNEKKEKIIEASIDEFAEKGYEKGSTNIIVKKAGISKGLIFHYFGNKKNLYLYMVNHAIDMLDKKLYDYVDVANTGDLFTRMKNWSLVKAKVFSENQKMYGFITNALISPPKDVEKEIKARFNELYQKNFALLLRDLDTSSFRNDIDINKAIELLMISLDGILKKYMEMYKGREKDLLNDSKKIKDEFDEYIEMLKWGLYES